MIHRTAHSSHRISSTATPVVVYTTPHWPPPHMSFDPSFLCIIPAPQCIFCATGWRTFSRDRSSCHLSRRNWPTRYRRQRRLSRRSVSSNSAACHLSFELLHALTKNGISLNKVLLFEPGNRKLEQFLLLLEGASTHEFG